MDIHCVWEHNGEDTLLYCVDFPGAYTRGPTLDIAMGKMKQEIMNYLKWCHICVPDSVTLHIVQDAPCNLQILDADSDVLFDAERMALTLDEYCNLKALVLKSAKDFQRLFDAIPDQILSCDPIRKTFYGNVPRTAREIYEHTKNVNAYYFGEIDIDADNKGSIFECRKKGFTLLEMNSDFLNNSVIEGSYGELWTLRKMLRRFIWHDRIHAKAMYRMAIRMFGTEQIPDVFCFGS